MKWLASFLSAVLLAGCSTLPFAAGQTKEEQPYPEGEWVGPVAVGEAERAILDGRKDGKNPTGWVFYDVRAEWQKLKKAVQPGDEIWEFRMNPLIVDGGDRYFGFSLVRGKRIIASVVTGVIDQHAP